MQFNITPQDIKDAATAIGLGTPTAAQKIQLATFILQCRGSDAYNALSTAQITTLVAQRRLAEMQRLQAMANTQNLAVGGRTLTPTSPVLLELQPFLTPPEGGWPTPQQ